MESIEALRKEIAALEKLIAARKSALHALLKGESEAGTQSLRFYGWRPLDAIRVVLRERGESMTRKEIHDVLENGGITKDKKRGAHNIRISIDLNIAEGNLIALKGDRIGLPEPQSDKKR